MSDIKLVCPACANSVSVSEYVSVPTIPCPKCKTPIEVVKTQAPKAAAQTQPIAKVSGPTLSGKEVKSTASHLDVAPNIADQMRERVLEEGARSRRKKQPKMELPKGKAIATLAIAFLVSFAIVMGMNMMSFVSPKITYWSMLRLDWIILVTVACVIAVMSFKEKVVIGVLLIGFPILIYFFAVSGMHFLIAAFAIFLHQLLLLQYVYYYMESWVFKGIYAGVLVSTICMVFLANTEKSVFESTRDSYYSVEKGDLQRTAAKITGR